MARRSSWGFVIVAGLPVVWAVGPAFGAGQLVVPGTVIFDMDTHTEFCDPDYWSFFGYPTVDFGSNGVDSEDGHAVFTAGNWTWCDLTYGPMACKFLGSKHGGGRMCCGQPLCGGLGSGVRDADLDLSLGTGITLRTRLILVGEGTPGVRLQFELADTNGLAPYDPSIPDWRIQAPDTTAVLPFSIPGKPYINRCPPLNGDGTWETITVWFDGLDSSYDAAAVAGVDPLDLTDINAFKTIWRRDMETSAGGNKIVFDEITLVDDPPVLWADDDGDGDVDLEDFVKLQVCFGADLEVEPECKPVDANYDAAVDMDDVFNFQECLQGPDVTTGFAAWCY